MPGCGTYHVELLPVQLYMTLLQATLDCLCQTYDIHALLVRVEGADELL